MQNTLTPVEILDRYIARYTYFEHTTGRGLTVQGAANHLRSLLTTPDMKFITVLERKLDEIMPTGI